MVVSMNVKKKQMKNLAVILGLMVAIFLAFALASSSTNFGRTVPVLMYHNIETVPRDVWSVSTDEFRRQMTQLKEQGYQTVLPSDLKGGLFRKLPRKPIVLTFDDGLLGCLTEAEPILKEVGFQAIIYVIVSNVAESGLERILYRGQESLSWDDIRGMHRRGTFTFGVHSFGYTPNKKRAAVDLWQCRYIFKCEVGVKPEHYCYPYGVAPDYLVEEVKQRKYKTGMICDDKLFTIDADSDWFRIPRVSVYGGGHDFKVELGSEVNNGVYKAEVSNDGEPLPVKVLLVYKDGRTWSTPIYRRCGAEVINCRWEGIPADVMVSDLAVEIWEQNGLFRYYP